MKKNEIVVKNFDIDDSPRKESNEWNVKVFTSDLKGKGFEGTDANVYISLIGSKGQSEKIDLNRKNLISNGKDIFETGSVDEFKVKTFDIGNLEKIKIGHDDSGFGSAWHLAKVEVKEVKTGKTLLFPCNRWLSKSDDDKKIERILSADLKPKIDIKGVTSSSSSSSSDDEKASSRKDLTTRTTESSTSSDAKKSSARKSCKPLLLHFFFI